GVATPLDGEIVQVTILPSHHDLNHLVQLEQGEVGRHDDAPPHGWLDVLKADLELIEHGREGSPAHPRLGTVSAPHCTKRPWATARQPSAVTAVAAWQGAVTGAAPATARQPSAVTAVAARHWRSWVWRRGLSVGFWGSRG